MDRKIMMDYRLVDRDAANFSDMLRSAREYENTLFVPDIAKKAALEAELEGICARLQALPNPDPVTDLVGKHISDFLDVQKMALAAAFDRPMKHTGTFVQTFGFASRKDVRPDAEKVQVVIDRFGQFDKVWAGLMTWMGNVSGLYLQETTDNCQLCIDTLENEKKKIDIYFPTLTEGGKAALVSAIGKLQTQMAEAIVEVKGILAGKKIELATETSEDDCIPFEESYYRSLLKNELGVQLDELLSWHEAEIEKTRNSVFDIMSRIKVSDPMPKTMGDINAILLKYAGPADSPEEMFRRGHDYLARTRAACREYVWLPEEWCDLRGVPEQLKVSYPWGGAGGGDPKSRNPIKGEIFFNEVNFKAVTDGWMKMLTVHEAYPGHHVQYVRGAVDHTPETIKMGAKYTPILEGLAHRSEPLFEFVFEEDPFYPLFVAYRRHHTAVRIKADLMLRYFGKPIREAVDLYVKELDFDRHVARGQVKAQEFMQGYFTCYYYGVKKLLEWESQYKLDKKDYTEMIISAGKMSLENFHSFINLSAAQKHSFTHDFASLLQFDENYIEKF